MSGQDIVRFRAGAEECLNQAEPAHSTGVVAWVRRRLAQAHTGSRHSAEEKSLSIDRYHGDAKDDRLLATVPPIPRRNERSRLDAGMGFSRHRLIGVVDVGVPDEGQGPPQSHHPCVDVLPLDEALAERSAVSVGPGRLTLPCLTI